MRFVILVILLLVVVLAVFAVGRGSFVRAEPAVQPIAFNHVIHVEDADLQCLDCHTDAETKPVAGLPGKNMCFECHDPEDEETSEHPEKKKLAAFSESDGNIPWVRVAVTEPDVYFSHRRHVTSGEIDCQRCHRDQSALTEPPPTARLVMTMDECLACHEERAVSVDCLVCHR